MKKLFAPVLIVFLFLALTACGGAEEPAPGPDGPPPPDLGLFERGVAADGVYTNDFAFLSFSLPPGWEFATEEQLNAAMGISPETAKDADRYRTALAGLDAIRDMVAMDPVSMNSVVVEFFPLSGAPDTDEASFLANIKESGALGEGSYTYTDGEDAVFGMNTFRTMRLLFQYEGLFIEQYYYLTRVDNFMLVITAGCADNSNPYSFMHYFE